MLLYYLTEYFTLLNFKLKIDPKTCTFKNLEEILKAGENLPKTSGNPVVITFSDTKNSSINSKLQKSKTKKQKISSIKIEKALNVLL